MDELAGIDQLLVVDGRVLEGVVDSGLAAVGVEQLGEGRAVQVRRGHERLQRVGDRR